MFKLEDDELNDESLLLFPEFDDPDFEEKGLGMVLGVVSLKANGSLLEDLAESPVTPFPPLEVVRPIPANIPKQLESNSYNVIITKAYICKCLETSRE